MDPKPEIDIVRSGVYLIRNSQNKNLLQVAGDGSIACSTIARYAQAAASKARYETASSIIHALSIRHV